MTRGKRHSLSATVRRATLIALALGSLLYLMLYASTTWHPYAVWLAAWSLTAVAFYGWDKWQARRRGWRVPEVVLLALALVGGFAGAGAGMLLFRHKIRDASFWAILVLATLLHAALATAWLL